MLFSVTTILQPYNRVGTLYRYCTVTIFVTVQYSTGVVRSWYVYDTVPVGIVGTIGTVLFNTVPVLYVYRYHFALSILYCTITRPN